MNKITYTLTDVPTPIVKGRLILEDGCLKVQLFNSDTGYWYTVVTLGDDKVIYVAPDSALKRFNLTSQDRNLK